MEFGLRLVFIRFNDGSKMELSYCFLFRFQIHRCIKCDVINLRKSHICSRWKIIVKKAHFFGVIFIKSFFGKIFCNHFLESFFKIILRNHFLNSFLWNNFLKASSKFTYCSNLIEYFVEVINFVSSNNNLI